MRNFIIVICLFVSPVAFGQTPKPLFQKTIDIGTSLTYIWDPESTDYTRNINYLYQELTWQKNVAFQWHPRWKTGINHLNIFTTSEEYGKNRYVLFGLFQQYHFWKPGKWSVFGEAGFYKGNYCTCGLADPYKRKGLSYLSIGAGANYPLSKRFNLDLAWLNFQLLYKAEEKYAYTQYIIGIDYLLPLRKK